MNKDQVKLFAGYVGTKVETISSQGWAQVKCPLAKWLHDSGKDSNPSAAISIKPDGESFFTCFTCEHHDLMGLVLRLRELGAVAPKVNIKEAMALVNAEGEELEVSLSIKDYDDPVSYEEDDGNNDATFPESWLDTFPRATRVKPAIAYLQSRGVDLHTAHDLDLRWDPIKRTVCFPTRDFYGRLCGLRGRYIKPEEDQPPYHIYKNPDKHYNRNVWIGENHLDFDKPVLMVESVFDYAACYPLYDNVVGPLTVGVGPRKVKRMSPALEVITLFDVGTGGDKARNKIDKYLTTSSITHLTPTGAHRYKPGQQAKDPGEMRPDALFALLSEHLPV